MAHVQDRVIASLCGREEVIFRVSTSENSFEIVSLLKAEVPERPKLRYCEFGARTGDDDLWTPSCDELRISTGRR
jgi:hypothetical protein